LYFSSTCCWRASRRHRRAQIALQIVGMGERLDHRPNELSGGQQQRVAIARALVGSPAVILADEPTGALDTKTSAEIMGILQQLNREQGLTVILVTHEHDIAAYAARVLTMRDGLLVSDGPLEQHISGAIHSASVSAGNGRHAHDINHL
jgi:putative ABC transport system ATP-binding protein